MMKKAISVHKKTRGRPATGQDPLISARVPTAIVTSILAWGKAKGVTRSEAIRRLVEIGLTVKTKGRSPNDGQKLRAREMAGKAIDQMTDTTATPDDQAGRNRRLLKGPEEFQEVRVDRPKRKP